MKKIIYILGLICCGFSLNAQHNPVVSHYMLNSLPLNPAFTGTRDALSISLNYRKQWVGFSESPSTGTLSIHAPTKNSKLGYGLLFLTDDIGLSNQTGALANVSYLMKTRYGKLSFGLAGGLINYRNAWSQVITTQDQDEVFNLGDESHWGVNFSAGMYYQTQTFFASLSSPFMLEGQYEQLASIETPEFAGPSNLKFYLTSGYKWIGRGKINIIPSFLVKYVESSPIEVDLNLQLEYDDLITIGATFRPNNAVIGILKYQINQKIAVGYGVDLAINDIANYNKGSHELSLLFDLVTKTNAKSSKFF